MSLIESIKSLEKQQDAFRDLYELHYDSMMGVCNRYAKDADEAKQIFREGFIDVFNMINRWEIDAVEDWMKVIMIDAAVAYLRKNKHDYNIVNTVKALDTFGMKEEEIIDDEIISNMKPEHAIAAIQKMSPAYRIVVNMHLVDGFSFTHIAERLDIAESTAKMNFEKAMYTLRKSIKQLSVNHA